LLHLFGGCIDQRLASMTATDIPQTGQPIDETIAIGIDQMRTLALDPDPRIGVARVVMQWVNHVLLIFVDQGAIAERGVHSINSLSGWGRCSGAIERVL
jgi:hypothetical protein